MLLSASIPSVSRDSCKVFLTASTSARRLFLVSPSLFSTGS